MKLKTLARISGFLLTLPALGAETSVRTLYDSDLDGWRLWTAYGPAVNERYGSGNNSKHWHDPAYVVASGKARILRAVDTGVGKEKRFMSGCLSTREAPGGRGFMRFGPGVDFLRFEFTVSISDWNHAVWPALWLRGDGGASVHEIDVLEGFTAQVGVDLYRFAQARRTSCATLGPERRSRRGRRPTSGWRCTAREPGIPNGPSYGRESTGRRWSRRRIPIPPAGGRKAMAGT